MPRYSVIKTQTWFQLSKEIVEGAPTINTSLDDRGPQMVGCLELAVRTFPTLEVLPAATAEELVCEIAERGNSRYGDVTRLQKLVEDAVLSGRMPVVPGHWLLKKGPLQRAAYEMGVVPLRWGAPRILLTTPAQGRIIREGHELQRGWRLWRYSWHDSDLAVVGSPQRTLTHCLQNKSSVATAAWGSGCAHCRWPVGKRETYTLTDRGRFCLKCWNKLLKP